MTWHQQFRGEAGSQGQRPAAKPRLTQVTGIFGIPFEASQDERFRLAVDVEKVVERETKTGNPYYFFECRDEEGMAFSIVVWNWQMSRFPGPVVKGTRLDVCLRVPKEGYSAFTLA